LKPRTLLKIGLVLSVLEGLILMLIVPPYWPLIGMPLMGGGR
jgi:hypothetical protein